MSELRPDRHLAQQAHIEAEHALAAKDSLHKEIGGRVDGELDRVAAAWRTAEVALQKEQLTWIHAHGSPALRQQAVEALCAGRVGSGEWRPGVPLDWDQAERLETLQPQLMQEWLAKERPGWIAWPLAGETVDPVTRVDRGARGPCPARAQAILQTAPIQALVTAAEMYGSATLCTYAVPGAPAEEKRPRFCATSMVRLPGGYAPVRLALKENSEQERQLDRIFEILAGPGSGVRSYEEKLAEVIAVETGKPVALMRESDDSVTARIARIDDASGIPRAILVCGDVAHILVVERDDLRAAVGKEVRIATGEGDRVFVAANNAAVVVGYEDVDAVQQLELRREMLERASGRERESTGGDAASRLRDVAQRVERRIADCRVVNHGLATQDEFLARLTPQVHELRRDSSLTTERLAWVAAYGSQEIARRSNRAEFENGVREEWLRAQSGWRPRRDDELDWKRVGVAAGPRNVHPSLTLRDTPPVKELMADAWAHAPDAVCAVRLGGDAAGERPVHGAVIARREPGAARVEALIREETARQRVQLNLLWKERAHDRGAAACAPNQFQAENGFRSPQTATERVIDRVQRELGVLAAPLPDASPVVGKLARIELGTDNRRHAIIAGEGHVHVCRFFRVNGSTSSWASRSPWKRPRAGSGFPDCHVSSGWIANGSAQETDR